MSRASKRSIKTLEINDTKQEKLDIIGNDAKRVKNDENFNKNLNEIEHSTATKSVPTSTKIKLSEATCKKCLISLNSVNHKEMYDCTAQCQIYDRLLSNRPNLMRHQAFLQKIFTFKSYMIHINEKHFYGIFDKLECDICGFVHKNKASIRRHLMSHLEKIKCELCDLKMNRVTLYNHMREVHVAERKYKCRFCPKDFVVPRSLNSHEKCHKKKFECTKCDYKFIDNYGMQMHCKLFHESSRCFKCDICDQKFNRKDHLNKHISTHDKNRSKPHKCQKCDYATDHRYSLTAHIKVHERLDAKIAAMENPLKCILCQKFCNDKFALKRRLKNVHLGSPWQCDLCGKYMKKRNGLKIHIEMHLKKKLEVEIGQF